MTQVHCVCYILKIDVKIIKSIIFAMSNIAVQMNNKTKDLIKSSKIAIALRCVLMSGSL